MRAISCMLCLLAMSCAGPQWVEVGSGRIGHGESTVLVGIGSVKGIANEGLAWSSADNRARAELAKQVEKFTTQVMRGVAKEIPPKRKRRGQAAHDTPMVAIQFNRAVLQFAEIETHWRRGKRYIARAVLPIAVLRRQALELKGVNKKTRQAMARQIDAVGRE